MKKIISVIFIAGIISISVSNDIHAVLKKAAPSEATILGQQLIKELTESVKETNTMFEKAAKPEKEDAAKNAREAAQNLIDRLNDIKTFGTDVIRGYNPKQVQMAAISLAEQLTRLNTIKVKIKSKRIEIADMTNVGVLYIETAVAGKEELRSQAIRDQKNLHSTKNHIEKAIVAQKEILGTTWSGIITSATYTLLIGNSLGICYGIDWSFGANDEKVLENNEPSIEKTPVKKSREKLTKRQHAAIKSWHRYSKSELLSKNISSTQQLTQAQDLLKKLNQIQEDLKDVPAKYKNTLYKINAAVDSLSNKMNAAKKSWLKLV